MSKKSIIQLSEFDINQKIIEAMSNVCTRSVLFSVKNESKDVPTIAEELKISISTVYKTLSNLEDLALAEVDKYVITSDGKKIKLYRSHGLEGRDNAKIIGVNSRLDSLHAEILTYRLKKLKNIIYRRKKNINLYNKYLKAESVKLIKDGVNEKNAYVMFIALSDKRNKLQKYLSRFNIQSLLYYPTALHLHNSMKFLGYKKGDLPNAETIANRVISFPHHQHLTKKQIKFVCSKINKFFEK